MGLGLNGGGLGAARFLHARGARVTVTDLKTADELRPAVEALPAGVRVSLGSHRMNDFTGCDLVVKNPGVRPDSPFLAAACAAGAAVETEQSLFLARCRAPVLAVTGSKGKSTTAAALAAILGEDAPATRLSGNIGGSPLDFLDELTADTPVVLELSSWQLGDLRGRGVLAPPVAVVTNLLRDHQNRYGSIEEYLQDKLVIAEGQPPDGALVLNADDPWHRRFAERAAGRVVLFSARQRPAGDGAWLQDGAGRISVAGRSGVAFDTERVAPAGRVIGVNLLAAAAAAASFGIEPATIRRALRGFHGLPHRLEPVGEVAGVRFVNDSAATIPEATVAALASVTGPVVLLAGGADKALDFTDLAASADSALRCVLLAGSATAKLHSALRRAGVACDGPFDSLEEAFGAALAAAACGAASGAASGATVLLSPACASFGMFRNEFDRGDRFRALVRRHAASR